VKPAAACTHGSDDPIGVELCWYTTCFSWCYVADARLDYLRDE